MKVGLIYPPADRRHEECFPMPSISIAVLADHLRNRGHEARIYDFDIPFQRRVRWARRDVDFGVLTDRRRVLDFIQGRPAGRKDAALRRVSELILGAVRPERCALYGITLVDMMRNRFVLHSAALIAHALKVRFGAPVVLGYQGIPQESYREILEQYPVFDYAVWCLGEAPLDRLIERLSGKGGPLLQTLARESGGVAASLGELPFVPCGGSDYEGYPLDLYRVSRDRLEGAYGFPAALVKLRGLESGRPDQLVVMHRFETTCKGTCAFCANDAASPSNRADGARIAADLAKLSERGVTGIYFTNANFNDDYRHAEELCDLMIRQGLGLQWSDCANFRALDERLLDKMRRAGAVRLAFGMETASPRLLRFIRKAATRSKIERCLRHSHELGIWNHVELIGGLPTETDEDLARTCGFIRELSDVVDQYTVSPFTLYRQSPFFKEAGLFGLRLRPGNAVETWGCSFADRRACEGSERFDETGGPAWPEKMAQIRRSSRTLAKAIQDTAPFGAMNRDHTHLLMHLYRVLGHSRKGLIRRIFRTVTRKFKPYHMDHFPGVVDLLAGV
ncbi:MAG: radical SAM protein [Elusimicrobia bacterium]|nr:radical SAM protein [Elusimicrobiota bacterium]